MFKGKKLTIMTVLAMLALLALASTSIALALGNGQNGQPESMTLEPIPTPCVDCEATPTPAPDEPVITMTMSQAIKIDFLNQYGAKVAELLQDPARVKGIYLLYWQSADTVTATLYLDGLFIDLISVPITQTEETP